MPYSDLSIEGDGNIDPYNNQDYDPGYDDYSGSGYVVTIDNETMVEYYDYYTLNAHHPDFNLLEASIVLSLSPIDISLTKEVYSGSGNTSLMKRKFVELNEWLHKSNDVPDGTTVMTGTGTIPPEDFTLQHGDQISITIQDIGTLVNEVIKV